MRELDRALSSGGLTPATRAKASGNMELRPRRVTKRGQARALHISLRHSILVVDLHPVHSVLLVPTLGGEIDEVVRPEQHVQAALVG